jgi:hypothetical protein
VPVIAVFDGITITMYYRDHPPPHFHARYGEHEAKFLISDGSLLDGVFPTIPRRRVNEWARRHREELALNWQRAEQRQSPQRISDE